MLSHIDDDEENKCKYVGADYHPRVFKAADIAVENLIMNGIIKAMINLMSQIEEWHHDQPEVKDEEKLEGGREVGKGGVQWVGHLGSEVDHLDLIDEELTIMI